MVYFKCPFFFFTIFILLYCSLLHLFCHKFQIHAEGSKENKLSGINQTHNSHAWLSVPVIARVQVSHLADANVARIVTLLLRLLKSVRCFECWQLFFFPVAVLFDLKINVCFHVLRMFCTELCNLGHTMCLLHSVDWKSWIKKKNLENVLYCVTTRSIFWSLTYLLIHNMLTPVDKVLCLSVANKAVFRGSSWRVNRLSPKRETLAEDWVAPVLADRWIHVSKQGWLLRFNVTKILYKELQSLPC